MDWWNEVLKDILTQMPFLAVMLFVLWTIYTKIEEFFLIPYKKGIEKAFEMFPLFEENQQLVVEILRSMKNEILGIKQIDIQKFHDGDQELKKNISLVLQIATENRDEAKRTYSLVEGTKRRIEEHIGKGKSWSI